MHAIAHTQAVGLRAVQRRGGTFAAQVALLAARAGALLQLVEDAAVRAAAGEGVGAGGRLGRAVQAVAVPCGAAAVQLG